MSEDALIHIGVRKAASTYLQSYFWHDQSINFANAAPAAREIATSVDGNSQLTLSGLLSYSREPDPAKKLVVSSEHFAFNPAIADTNAFMELSANVLAEAFPGGKILIVTRGPQSWLRSAYAQSLRADRQSLTFTRFLHVHRSHILAVMNYGSIAETYGRAFGSDAVLLLPQEMLRDDADDFYKRLRSFANLPPAQHGVAFGQERNIRPSEEELKLRLTLGRITSLLVRHGKSDGLYSKNSERDPLLALNDFYWQYMSNSKALPRLAKILGVDAAGLYESPLLDGTIAAAKQGARCLRDMDAYRNYQEEYFD